MSTKGLEGAVLEHALEQDEKRRALEQPLPSAEATKVVQDLVEMRERIQAGTTRSLDLPTMMSIIPVDQGGTVYYECWLSGFGHRVKATSRSKVKAMAYALRDLAEKVLQESE